MPAVSEAPPVVTPPATPPKEAPPIEYAHLLYGVKELYEDQVQVIIATENGMPLASSPLYEMVDEIVELPRPDLLPQWMIDNDFDFLWIYSPPGPFSETSSHLWPVLSAAMAGVVAFAPNHYPWRDLYDQGKSGIVLYNNPGDLLRHLTEAIKLKFEGRYRDMPMYFGDKIRRDWVAQNPRNIEMVASVFKPPQTRRIKK